MTKDPNVPFPDYDRTRVIFYPQDNSTPEETTHRDFDSGYSYFSKLRGLEKRRGTIQLRYGRSGQPEFVRRSARTPI